MAGQKPAIFNSMKRIIPFITLLMMLFSSCSLSEKESMLYGEWKPVKMERYEDKLLVETKEGIGLSEDENEQSITITRKLLTFNGLETALYGICKFDAENMILAFKGDFFYRVAKLDNSELILSFDEDYGGIAYRYLYYYSRLQ